MKPRRLRGPAALMRRLLLLTVCLLLFTAAGQSAARAEQLPQKTVRVGWYNSPYNYTTPQGCRTGYAYEYQQKIAAYTGWRYEYVEGSWPELLEKLRNREIDLLSDVSYTSERAEEMLYASSPMGSELYYLFVAADNTAIDPGNLASLNGKRIGVNKDSVQADLLRDWARQNGLTVEVVERVSNESESVELLLNGELDGFVTLDVYGEADSYVPILKIGGSDFYFAVSKSRSDLLGELNGALSRIEEENRAYNQQMYERYISSAGTHAFLRRTELDWIRAHGAIRVGYVDNNLPYSDYDEGTGELTGGLATFLELASEVAENARPEFSAVPYPTAEAALEALQRAEIDCAFPVSLNAHDEEQMDLSVAATLLETELYAVVRKSDQKTFLSEEDHRVAVPTGDRNCEIFLRNYYPQWEQLRCQSVEDGFRSVERGEADCVLLSSYRLARTERERERCRLTIIPTGKTLRLSCAVRRDNAELYLILNKLTSLVSKASLETSLLNHSLPETRFSLLDYLKEHIVPVILGILALSGLTVLLILRRVERMRRELEERRRLQSALSGALTEAEAANKAKTTFLSSMSHEIRTPMNAIIGLDTLALREENLSAQTRDYLEKIGVSARHLLALINDILDMSRIESGRMVLRSEEFSFSDLLEQINTMVLSQCRDKDLRYECRVLTAVDERCIGDDAKLREVLLNILSNAIKFTEPPGSVTLSVERTAQYEDHSTLRFRVKDTGIGMDEAFLPKIFDTFSQEDASRKNKYGSTGLGMAITKNLVELMNGTISVESKKGVGTRFTVTIPLRCARCRNPEWGGVDPSGVRALITQDDAQAAEQARQVLTGLGLAVEVCGGEEALHRLELSRTKQNPFQMVLLDWDAPDAPSLAAQIRARFGGETAVLALVCAQPEADAAPQADGFLVRPLFPAKVIEEVRRLTRRGGPLAQDAPTVELAGRRVLLAEDMEINAEIMMDLLDMEEMEADHAENGREAVELFQKSAPGSYAAILMDIRMPEMDGLEAAAAIRALERPDAKTIPIIALTANAFDEDVQRSLQAGMNAHLSKPVDPESLFQALRELIAQAQRP